MTKEFNLSEKIMTKTIGLRNALPEDIEIYFSYQDVKEFIRLLKKEVTDIAITEGKEMGIVMYNIDKLAGSQLIDDKEVNKNDNSRFRK